MSIHKVVAAAAVLAILQIPQISFAADNASGERTCDQARKDLWFLRQMAITDGNPQGFPYNDESKLKECAARDNTAKNETGKDAMKKRVEGATNLASY